MKTPFISSIDEFIKIVENHRSTLQKMGGDCYECPKYKTCLTKSKETHIEVFLHMNEDETRFPGLLKMKNRKMILAMVPTFVYRKALGMYSSHLPCPFNNRMIVNNLNAITETYQLLSDKVSKLTFLNVLMYRVTMNADYILRAYSSYPEYFIPGFRGLSSSEVYVDCGAFNGDSFASYCLNNEPPRSAYLFELDPKNASELEKAVAQYVHTEAHVIKKGVHKAKGELYFVHGARTGKVGSYLSETPIDGAERVEVVSIDDAVKDRVSFIKMDIEGSELDALLGAKQHILEAYPKLVICLYHRVEDLWEIPLTIHRLFSEYTHFELHHHSTVFSDTVLYVRK